MSARCAASLLPADLFPGCHGDADRRSCWCWRAPAPGSSPPRCSPPRASPAWPGSPSPSRSRCSSRRWCRPTTSRRTWPASPSRPSARPPSGVALGFLTSLLFSAFEVAGHARRPRQRLLVRLDRRPALRPAGRGLQPAVRDGVQRGAVRHQTPTRPCSSASSASFPALPLGTLPHLRDGAAAALGHAATQVVASRHPGRRPAARRAVPHRRGALARLALRALRPTRWRRRCRSRRSSRSPSPAPPSTLLPAHAAGLLDPATTSLPVLR